MNPLSFVSKPSELRPGKPTGIRVELTCGHWATVSGQEVRAVRCAPCGGVRRVSGGAKW